MQSAMKLCKVCDLADWEEPDFLALLGELHLSPGRDLKHRKHWEFVETIRGLKQLGRLAPDAVALSVGAGHEHVLYFLANVIARVHATDIYGSGGFAAREAAAEMLTNPEKFAPFPYRRDHLVVEYMDGRRLTYPDASFDIVFSLSSIEHFGGHEAATAAMREMSRVLRPGGVAVVTTEVILNDLPHSDFFLPDELITFLVVGSGLSLVDTINFNISPSLLENPVDLMMDDKRFPHIVCKIGPWLFTSVLMFLTKSGNGGLNR